MNWFERHLNWTLVLSWIIFVPLFNIFSDAARPSVYFLGDFAFRSTISTAGTIIFTIFAVIFLRLFLWTAVWVVKQKNRSLSWLFLLPLPIAGVIALLALKNRKEKQGSDTQGVNKVGWRTG